MKQIGNLAIVCAGHKNTLMQILGGDIAVFFGEGPGRTSLRCRWDDDERIRQLVYELNHGIYKE